MAEMERALFSKYLGLMTDEEASLVHEAISDCDSSVEHCQVVVENAAFEDLMKGYESFVHVLIDGQYGSTAAYWATYVYLINRVNRELQHPQC